MIKGIYDFNNKGYPEMKDTFKNIIFLLLSYCVLLLLPHELNFYSYALLGVSVFLFCIGYFRMDSSIKKLTETMGFTTVFFLWTAIGVFFIAFGSLYLYIDKGSGRSLVMAFTLLIEGLVIFGTSGGNVVNLRAERLNSKILYIFSISLFAFAVFTIVNQKIDGVTAATMMVVEGILVLIMGVICTYKQKIDDLKTPIRDLYNRFAYIETPLGFPTFGNIGGHKDCIIYGPSPEGFSVFGYYNRFGKFCLELADAGKEVMTIDDSHLLDSYGYMFEDFAKTGKARWTEEPETESDL